MNGVNFAHGYDLRCCFWNVKTIATFINETLVSCFTPEMGFVQSRAVEITNNNQNCSDNGVMFAWENDIVVENIFPDWGLKSGGTVISCEYHEISKMRCIF